MCAAVLAAGCGRQSGSPSDSPTVTPLKPAERIVPDVRVPASCYIDKRFCIEAPAGDRSAILDLQTRCGTAHGIFGGGTCTPQGHVATCLFRDDSRKIRYYNVTLKAARVFCEEQAGGQLSTRY
jgi:hypothetical protein